MKKSVNQWAFPGGLSLGECLKLASDTGFEAVELAIAEEGTLNLDVTKEKTEKVAEEVRNAGLEVASLATGLFWKYSLTSSSKDVSGRAKEIVVKMLNVASWLGTDAILVVPGCVNVPWDPASEVVPYEVAYERAREALRELAPVAQKFEVHIGVENVWNNMLLSPLEMRKFIEEIDNPYVGVYFDVGNVLITGFPEHWISILGKIIKRIHLKDFKTSVGNINGFCNLLEGDVNWQEVIKALKEIGYDSYVTAEIMPPYKCCPETLLSHTSLSMDKILCL